MLSTPRCSRLHVRDPIIVSRLGGVNHIQDQSPKWSRRRRYSVGPGITGLGTYCGRGTFASGYPEGDRTLTRRRQCGYGPSSCHPVPRNAAHRRPCLKVQTSIDGSFESDTVRCGTSRPSPQPATINANFYLKTIDADSQGMALWVFPRKIIGDAREEPVPSVTLHENGTGTEP